MVLDINLGGRRVRPSETEQQVAAAGAGALVLGLLLGNSTLKLGGALVLAGVAYAVYDEGQLFVAPETMNAHFLTDGRLSAMNGPAQAAALEDVFRTGQGSSSRRGVSYAPRPRGRR